MKSLLVIAIATLACTVSSMAQNVPSYVPTDGIVGWWPFNGNANDESGNGLNGIVVDAALSTDRFNNANSSYIYQDLIQCCPYIQTLSNLNFNQNEISGSFWFKPDFNYQLGSAGTFISSYNFIQLQYNGGGLIVQIWGSSGYQGFTLPTTLNAGIWYHFAFSKAQSGLVTIYLNGVNYNLGAYNGTLNSTSFGSLAFGRSTAPSWPDPFRGSIDDICIWNRVLTQEEITDLNTATNTTNNNQTSNTTANVPGAISYQAVARDAQGAPLADTNLQVRFTLLADSLSGSEEYVETHNLSTNSLGLFTTAFGAGTPVSNTFDNINWSAGHKFLNVQVDSGNGLVDIGTQQLLSTPYSLYSAKAGEIKNPGLPVFSDNAAALAGGLVAGDMYRTAEGVLMVVY